MVDLDIGALQGLMARTWPGLEHGAVGEWKLRAGEGFTARANSALVVGDPGVGLGEALDLVERWYRERGLTPRVQIPASVDGSRGLWDALGEECELRGWIAEPWALVLVRRCHARARDGGATREPVGPGRTDLDLTWMREPDDTWLDLYHHRGSTLPESARQVITAAPADYLTAGLKGELVGIGRVALADQVAVLTAIEVVPHARRRGIGALITHALAARGGESGANLVALQVFADNDVAVRLYRRLGYTDHHRYRYFHRD